MAFLNDMDIKTLQVFSHLAKSLHFGQTAYAFHVSPSTLSRMIQRIEDQLGCQVLERDNRSVQLTSQGRQFEAFAMQQIQQWQAFQSSLKTQQKQLTGTLSVYCSVTAAYSHLPQVLDGFRRVYPQIEIILETGSVAAAVEKVKSNQVDIAITALPEKLSSRLDFHPIAKIPLSIIAPTIDCQVSQQLQPRQIDWQQLPIILPEHGLARKRFEDWYRQKEVGKPNIYATVAGHEALVSMVALGCGVGIAPEVVIENSPVKERIRRLTEPTAIKPFELVLCYSKKQKHQPIVNAFLNTLQ